MVKSRENSFGGLAEVLSVFAGNDERERDEELTFRERMELMAKEKEIWDQEKADLEALVAHLQRANRTLIEERQSLMEKNVLLQTKLAAATSREADNASDDGDSLATGPSRRRSGRKPKRRNSFDLLLKGGRIATMIEDDPEPNEPAESEEAASKLAAATSREAEITTDDGNSLATGSSRRRSRRKPKRRNSFDMLLKGVGIAAMIEDDPEPKLPAASKEVAEAISSTNDYEENYDGPGDSRHSTPSPDILPSAREHGQHQDEVSNGQDLLASFGRLPIEDCPGDADDREYDLHQDEEQDVVNCGEDLLASFRRLPSERSLGDIADQDTDQENSNNRRGSWWQQQESQMSQLTFGSKDDMDASLSNNRKWGFWSNKSEANATSAGGSSKDDMDVSISRIPLPPPPTGKPVNSTWFGGRPA